MKRQVQDEDSILCAHCRSSPRRKVGSGVAAVFNKINRRVLSFCFLRVKARIEVAKLFPPMPVPAPSLRRLRMCGGHPCAPWRRQTLTCCATSRCCFLRTGRKQCMRDSFRLRYPAGSFSRAGACHSLRSPTPELRDRLGASLAGKQRGVSALARSLWAGPAQAGGRGSS